jgi:hypothetical protein
MSRYGVTYKPGGAITKPLEMTVKMQRVAPAAPAAVIPVIPPLKIMQLVELDIRLLYTYGEVSWSMQDSDSQLLENGTGQAHFIFVGLGFHDVDIAMPIMDGGGGVYHASSSEFRSTYENWWNTCHGNGWFHLTIEQSVPGFTDFSFLLEPPVIDPQCLSQV